MLLVIDIGNSNIVMGTYSGKILRKHWRISTDRQKTGDEYGMLINDLFRYQGVKISDVKDIIISSVVPPLVVPLTKMCERCFKIKPKLPNLMLRQGLLIISFCLVKLCNSWLTMTPSIDLNFNAAIWPSLTWTNSFTRKLIGA